MNQREAQAAESKQKLVDSAKSLFAEKGYNGTSVREINRSVGLADGLLYHYFPGGKKDIFKEIVEENIHQIVEAFSDHSMVSTYVKMPIENMLEAVYQNFAEIINTHMDVVRMVFRESEVRDIISKKDVMRILDSNAPWFKNLLEEKNRLGQIRDMDFESAAIAMEGLLMNHLIAIVLGLDSSILSDPEERKKLFCYYADMWKKPK